MRTLIGWIGTIVVAFVFSVVLVTISTPLLSFIQRLTHLSLVGKSWPHDSIYLGTWFILVFILHWFVFRKKRRKRRGK